MSIYGDCLKRAFEQKTVTGQFPILQWTTLPDRQAKKAGLAIKEKQSVVIGQS